MQLFAWDEGGLVFVDEAVKNKDYSCPECKKNLRLRSGEQRQKHFYHLETSLNCSQHKKSLPHIQAQLFLYRLFPSGQCQMERRFEEVSRIADVAWEKEKIIFEVQCSPISKQEAEERCRDYRSIGWRIIWILHDARFNKSKLSAAELHLRAHGCYFTSIDAKGEGNIYDQFECLQGPRRRFKGSRLQVDMRRPCEKRQDFSEDLPVSIKTRIQSWELCFTGDLTDRLLKLPIQDASILRLKSLEEKFSTRKRPLLGSSVFEKLRRLYFTFFRLLLEKLSH